MVLMKNEILTIREVAQYLKLTEKTAYRLAAEGHLPGFKVGGSWRFRTDEIETFTKKESKKKKSKPTDKRKAQ
jgi:excisionase family DNA binding protein